MPWWQQLTRWFSDHSTLMWWLSAGSLAFFLLSPVVVAWLVTQLPVDYFAKRRRRAFASWDKYPTTRAALLIAKTAVGLVLVIAGIVMLVAPGQGLLTIAVGLMLAEFPGKYRAERWLVTRPKIWRSLNWLRKRAGRPELKPPRRDGLDATSQRS